MTNEESKAVQEVAKISRKALEIAERTGPFLEKVFGPLVENAVGVVSDQLTYYRTVNYLNLVDKTETLLSRRNVSSTRHVPPSFALPLIQAATVEDSEEIHDLWAKLFATAIDSNAPKVRRSYVEILRQFEPIDAKLLHHIYKFMFDPANGLYVNTNLGGGISCDLSDLASQIRVSAEELEVSLYNIDRTGCITLKTPINLGDAYQPMRSVHIRLTALGKALVEVCIE